MDRVYLFLKDNNEVLSLILSMFMMIFSVYIYYNTVRRDCKNQTIKELSEIRMKFPGFDKKIAREYIQSLEFFAVGVNEGIYDIKIVKRMSGKRLISQYKNGAEEYLHNSFRSDDYQEYKKLIATLERYYK